MSLAILAVGTALPATAVTREESLHIARAICCRSEAHATWLPGIYAGSGIQNRHLAFDREIIDDVLRGTRESGSGFLPTGDPEDQGPTIHQRMVHYAEQAAPLALASARRALTQCGCSVEKITHLVTVSCTGFQAPGVDIALMKGLGLPSTTARTHLGFMGCHGAVNGLRVAKAFVEADRKACVLVCAVELCSLHYHYAWDPQQMVANALFADGAASVVGVAGEHSQGAWTVEATGSYLFADSEDAMSWSIGDHHFEMTLSRRVPGLIARNLRQWLADWLGEHGLSVQDVVSWAVHPGGPRILAAVEESLDLEAGALDDSKSILAECGNMSSPTLVFIIDRLLRRNAPRPCVALGFGPGLVVEAMLLG
jgi:predicted naringenin-chalcone synthase